MGQRENYLNLISNPFVKYFQNKTRSQEQKTQLYLLMAYAYMSIIRAKDISVKDMEHYIDIILSHVSVVWLDNQDTNRSEYFNKTREMLIDENNKKQNQVAHIGIAFIINAILCIEHQLDQTGYIDISEKEVGAKENIEITLEEDKEPTN